MAIHSIILAQRVPWTEEPGRLQSMGSQSWTRLNFLSFLKVSCVFQYLHDSKSFTIWSKVSLEVRHLPSPKDCQSFLDDYILERSFPGTCKRLFPVLKLKETFEGDLSITDVAEHFWSKCSKKREVRGPMVRKKFVRLEGSIRLSQYLGTQHF